MPREDPQPVFKNTKVAFQWFVNLWSAAMIDKLSETKREQRMTESLGEWKTIRAADAGATNGEGDKPVLRKHLLAAWNAKYPEFQVEPEYFGIGVEPEEEKEVAEPTEEQSPPAEAEAEADPEVEDSNKGSPEGAASPSNEGKEGAEEEECEVVDEVEEEEEGGYVNYKILSDGRKIPKGHKISSRYRRDIMGAKYSANVHVGNHDEFDDAFAGSQNTRHHVYHVGETKDVHLRGVFVGFEKNLLIDSSDVLLQQGRTYGLIGPNGSGKSSLMKALAYRRIHDYPLNVVTMYIDQEMAGSEKNAVEVVLEGHKRLMLAREKEKELLAKNKGGEELDDVIGELEALQSSTAELRAKAILKEMRFTDAMMEEESSTLSGGWRMRVALAQALFMEPDVLMLDEPTNHLDLHAIIWLEDFLRGLGICIVVTSHDKAFLDGVCSDIILIRDKKLVYYNNSNYTDYRRVFEERQARAANELDMVTRKETRMKASIEKGKQQAAKHHDDKKLGMVASRQKKLEKGFLDKHEDGKRIKQSYHYYLARREATGPIKEQEVKFKFPEPSVLTYRGALLLADEASFHYPPAHGEKPRNILSKVSLRVDAGSRIGILGPNGSGKSTFLGMLLGDLKPQAGEITCHHSIRVGYFCQHHLDGLDLSLTPLRQVMNKEPSLNEGEARAKLGMFGLSGGLMVAPMSILSGGQKARVLFAIMTAQNPHLMVLDEPTNHLDMPTISALINALKDYSGGIILVSHDRTAMEEIPTELYRLTKGTLKRFEGTMDSYVDSVYRELKLPKPDRIRD